MPSAPLLDRTQLLDHPQIVASGTVARETVGDFGEVRQANPAARFDKTASTLRLPAPRLGQHSREILKSLGYDDQRCDGLIDEKIVLETR